MSRDSSAPASSLAAEMGAWLAREKAFHAAQTADELRAVARALPLRPSPHAEVHELQRALLLRAWPQLEGRPQAPRPEAWMPAASRAGWARFALLVEPTGCAELLDNSRPWQALLEGLVVGEALDPLATIDALLGRSEGEPRRFALRALVEAVEAGLVAITDAKARLHQALHWGDPGLRGAVWRALASPWGSQLAIPSEELEQGVFGDDEAEALEAIEAAGVRGLPEAMEPHPGRPGERRRAALRWAGLLGGHEAIDRVLEAANEDPGELAAAALGALEALHHRGLFVQPRQAPAVLALLASGVEFDPDQAAGILFVARRAIVERLPGLDADDPDWSFLLPLLARWLRSPRPPSGMHEAMRRVAAGARRPALASRALKLLRWTALDLPALPREGAEAVALSRLGELPEECIDLLEIVGGEAARGALLERSGWRGGRSDEALEPHLGRVFALLWWLSDEAQRDELLWRADERWLTDRIRASMAPPVAAQRRRRLALRPDDEGPAARLVALAAVAEPDDLSEVEAWVRRALEQAVAEPWRRPAGGGEPRFDPERGGEDAWRLPDACMEALDRMEASWRERHARPIWLLAPVKRLAAELLLRLLEGELPRTLRGGALRSLVGRGHPRLALEACKALASEDADEVKLGARLLVGSGVSWMSLELRRKVEEGDERVVRACLEALASERSPQAEALAREALSHRNMNIKKAAAEALVQVATAASADEITRWLAQHDNPGLRASLTAALSTALGAGFTAGLLAAIDAAGDERRRRLLIEALDRRLTAAQVRVRLRRRPEVGRALLAALDAGTIQLASGSLDDLAPERAAAGMPAPRPSERAREQPTAWQTARDALYHEGWSPERVAAALARWPARLGAEDVEKLKVHFGPWLDWMETHAEGRPAALIAAALADASEGKGKRISRAKRALLPVLERCSRGQRVLLLPLIHALLPRLDAAERLALGERLREHLGDTPGLETSPLGLLKRCGLLLRRGDVERALDGVGQVKDPAAVRRQILADAFDIRPARLPAHVVEGDELRPTDDEASALADALRAHGAAALIGLRGRWPLEGEVTLAALCHELPAAWPTAAVREAALDWMEELRPVGAAWGWPAPLDDAAWYPKQMPELLDHSARIERIQRWLRGDSTPPDRATYGWMTLHERDEALAQASTERLWQLVDTHEPTLLGRAVRRQLEARWAQLSTAEKTRLEAGRDRRPPPGWRDEAWGPQALARHRALRDQVIESPHTSPADATEADVARWLDEARGRDEEAARVALSKLSGCAVGGWRELLLGLAERGPARVRLHALRLIRKTLSPADTLAAARWFLQDEDPTSRRMAVRIACHGRDIEALPAVIALLLDPVSWVRGEALEGLRRMPDEAAPLVRRARDHARPDAARAYQQALDWLQSGR